jgi:hypothetical protein
MYSNKYLKSFILNQYKVNAEVILEGQNLKDKIITITGIDIEEDEIPLICQVIGTDIEFLESPNHIKQGYIKL